MLDEERLAQPTRLGKHPFEHGDLPCVPLRRVVEKQRPVDGLEKTKLICPDSVCAVRAPQDIIPGLKP